MVKIKHLITELMRNLRVNRTRYALIVCFLLFVWIILMKRHLQQNIFSVKMSIVKLWSMVKVLCNRVQGSAGRISQFTFFKYLLSWQNMNTSIFHQNKTVFFIRDTRSVSDANFNKQFSLSKSFSKHVFCQ